ncbi:putative DUF21 domain-containing protein [Hibiscus syriacus]|uniref:DUF21 domain-containing protein n=1 Tax=Hibiscus syriacus TaxID=106335 RepID=A0A6A3C0S2_HIBSY|nr:putative DUF21 domain-containing protein [Hibiscus syriacus]
MMFGNAIAVARTFMASPSSPKDIVFEPDDIPLGSFEWFFFAGISCLLVLFAGIMSGLTLGLMSLSLVDLEFYREAELSPRRNKLALPITLDKMFHPLLQSSYNPQAVCSRYGLAIGANFVWLVLDAVIGHGDALFRRAQLKALVSIHSQEAGKGGELTHDEATIISGALD